MSGRPTFAELVQAAERRSAGVAAASFAALAGGGPSAAGPSTGGGPTGGGSRAGGPTVGGAGRFAALVRLAEGGAAAAAAPAPSTAVLAAGGGAAVGGQVGTVTALALRGGAGTEPQVGEATAAPPVGGFGRLVAEEGGGAGVGEGLGSAAPDVRLAAERAIRDLWGRPEPAVRMPWELGSWPGVFGDSAVAEGVGDFLLGPPWCPGRLCSRRGQRRARSSERSLRSRPTRLASGCPVSSLAP